MFTFFHNKNVGGRKEEDTKKLLEACVSPGFVVRALDRR